MGASMWKKFKQRLRVSFHDHLLPVVRLGLATGGREMIELVQFLSGKKG